MRELLCSELSHVSGADGLYVPPGDGVGGGTTDPLPETKSKNNNGYGNGAESGLAPGRSGAALPGADQNIGPRGDR
jgi:hypothetical protein